MQLAGDAVMQTALLGLSSLSSEPGFELLVKVALDLQDTCQLFDLGSARLCQQWTQKIFHIFHILLQGPNMLLRLPDQL